MSTLVSVGAAVALAIVAPRQYDLAPTWAAVPLLVVGGLVLAQFLLVRRRGWFPLIGMVAVVNLGLVSSVMALAPRVERHLGGKTPSKYIAAEIGSMDPGRQAPWWSSARCILGCSFISGGPF